MSFAQNAGVLIAGQLVSKLFTFSLNQLLLLYTTPSALGISQLVEFVLDYTFFLSREAVRLTVSKLPKENDTLQWTINYSFLSSIIFLVLGLPTIYWKILNNEVDISSQIYPFNLYHICISIVLCALFELQAEPYYNINQYIDSNINARAKIEGLAGFSRCITQFLTILFISPYIGLSKYDANAYVFGYCVGQIAYSFTIYISYLWIFNFDIKMPKRVTGSWISADSWSYFKSIFVQQIFKNFLTVGDKFIITSLLSIESQGNYSFISNYGSLIARMLFAPLEESTRITITSLFKSKDKESQKLDFIELQRFVSNILKIYIYLLLLILTFAPINSKFLLSFIFKNFSSNDIVETFKLYWVYIVFLALNGILEAMFQSLFNSKTAVDRYSIFMILNTVIFFLSLIILIGKLDMGLKGLLYANILNMWMRITYCLINVRNFILNMEKTTKHEFNLNLGHYSVFATLSAIIFIVQYAYFRGEVTSIREFLISGSCGIVLVIAAAYPEIKLRYPKTKND